MSKSKEISSALPPVSPCALVRPLNRRNVNWGMVRTEAPGKRHIKEYRNDLEMKWSPTLFFVPY